MTTNHLQDGLYKVLSEEKSIYQSLLELAGQKKDAVVEGNAHLLDTIVARERKSLSAIKQLENERADILAGMAGENMIPSKDMTLEQLAAHLGARAGKRFSDLKDEFKRIISELQKYNEQNKKLIGTQLEYASFCMETFMQAGNIGNNYNNSGSTAGRNMESMGILDKEI
jgi:flagellar biosynthesis/type III secretory pathway chaperone